MLRSAFVDREEPIQRFRELLSEYEESGPQPKVLTYNGIGGAGKSCLILYLERILKNEYPKVPSALLELGEVVNKLKPLDESLNLISGQLRVKLRNYKILKNYQAIRSRDHKQNLIELSSWGSVALKLPPKLSSFTPFPWIIFPSEDEIQRMLSPLLRKSKWLRKRFLSSKTLPFEDVENLDETNLAEEILPNFQKDLKLELGSRKGRKGMFYKAVVFFDDCDCAPKYWEGQRPASFMEDWFIELIKTLLACRVLPILCSRAPVAWIQNPKWHEQAEIHSLNGLPMDAACDYLRAQLGSQYDKYQGHVSAILDCCREGAEPPHSYHAYSLESCAGSFMSNLETHGKPPDLHFFTGGMPEDVSGRIAHRFLKSLNESEFEDYIRHLSLTPKFDQKMALDLSYWLGQRSIDWNRLTLLSLIEQVPRLEGYFRLKRVVRDVLVRELITDRAVTHRRFRDYWNKKGNKALAWYHEWWSDPSDGKLMCWVQNHDNALIAGNIASARELLDLWAFVDLDRDNIGQLEPEHLATTHYKLAVAGLKTPMGRPDNIDKAIDRLNKVLIVYPNTNHKSEVYGQLASAFLQSANRGRDSNIDIAWDYLKEAELLISKEKDPGEWIDIQRSLSECQRHMKGPRNQVLDQANSIAEVALEACKALPQFIRKEASILIDLGEIALENQQSTIARDRFGKAVEIWRDYSEKDAEATMEWARAETALAGLELESFASDTGEFRNALERLEHIIKDRIDKENYPDTWANVQIAISKGLRKSGDYSGALESLLMAARDVFSEGDFPLKHAEVLYEIGRTHRMWSERTGKGSLSDAAQNFSKAIIIYDRKRFPQGSAAARFELAEILETRWVSERNQPCLEQAIQTYQKAAEVFAGLDLQEDETRARTGLRRLCST